MVAFFVVIVFFQINSAALAQGPGLDDTAGLEDLQPEVRLPETDIYQFIYRIINSFLGLLGIILVGLITYGGWMYMTSEGDPDKIARAKKILQNSIIGLLVILSSFAIAAFVFNVLLGGSSGGGFNPFDGRDPNTIGVTALGDGIIQSHYPQRDQTDVPMNTSIIITFKQALDPATVCADANANNTFCDAGDTLIADAASPVKDRIMIYKVDDLSKYYDEEKNTSDQRAPDTINVTSTDYKTFIFKPKSPLGSQGQQIWYAVKLIEGELAFANNESIDFGIDNMYVWKFQTNGELDLTSPKVTSVFPYPDDTQDDTGTVTAATQSSGSIMVTAQPNVARDSSVGDPQAPAGLPSEKAIVSKEYGCQWDGTIRVSINNNQATVAANGVTRGPSQGLINGDDVADQVASIGCGLSLTPADGTFTEGNAWNIAVKAKIDADTLRVGSITYTFISDPTDLAQNKIEADGTTNTAKNIISVINNATNGNGSVSATAGGTTVNLTAKTAGIAGDNITLSSKSSALTIKSMTGGSDTVTSNIIHDRPDEYRNAIVQINFDEAMNPLQLQGPASEIQNYISVEADGTLLDGIFEISNNYKTVEFRTNDNCGQNSCGDDTYCLPADANIRVFIKAADLYICNPVSSPNPDLCSLTSENRGGFGEYPVCNVVGRAFGVCQDSRKASREESEFYPQWDTASTAGAMDVSFNSLDGNKDGIADGPEGQSGRLPYSENNQIAANHGDDYEWSFWTNDQVNLDSPIIEDSYQKLGNKNLVRQGDQALNADHGDPLRIKFNELMMSSSLKPGRNYPDDFYNDPSGNIPREYAVFVNYSGTPLGYWVGKEDYDIEFDINNDGTPDPADGFDDQTEAVVSHTTFGDSSAYGFLIGSGVKDIYQNCYNPARDTSARGQSTCNVLDPDPNNNDIGLSCCRGEPLLDPDDVCHRF